MKVRPVNAPGRLNFYGRASFRKQWNKWTEKINQEFEKFLIPICSSKVFCSKDKTELLKMLLLTHHAMNIINHFSRKFQHHLLTFLNVPFFPLLVERFQRFEIVMKPCEFHLRRDRKPNWRTTGNWILSNWFEYGEYE